MPDRDLIAEPIPTEELLAATANGWAPFGARMATELLDARARIATLLDTLERCQGLARDRRDDLLIANTELEQARARIAELQGERVADEFGIQSLTTENGVATLAIVPTTEQARELVLALSLACGQMLDADQAQNYIEFEASPANRPGYIVHVRRAGGPSPHTLRREAEARAEQAEARITELEQVERYAVERALAAESKLEEERADFKAAEAELEQQAGQSLGYVVVLKDNEGDLTCLASVFGPDAVRTAEGIGSGYAASKGDEYLIAELREVSDRG